MNYNDTKEYLDKMFSILDLDDSGLISYDKFLSAMISRKKNHYWWKIKYCF